MLGSIRPTTALVSNRRPVWVDCSWSQLRKEGAECGVKQSEASWWKVEPRYDGYRDIEPGFWTGAYVNDNCVTLDINQQSASHGAPSLSMTDVRDVHSIWLMVKEVQ